MRHCDKVDFLVFCSVLYEIARLKLAIGSLHIPPSSLLGRRKMREEEEGEKKFHMKIVVYVSLILIYVVRLLFLCLNAALGFVFVFSRRSYRKPKIV
jgi:hypothetical protein